MAFCLSLTNSFFQYEAYRHVPKLEYATWGARYVTTADASFRVFWRMVLSNNGRASADNVHVQILDLPESATVHCTYPHEIETRTKNSVVIKLDVPASERIFISVLPYVVEETDQHMPYCNAAYNADGLAGHDQYGTYLESLLQRQVCEVLGRKLGHFKEGLWGRYRVFGVRVPVADVEAAKNNYEVEDW
jgi:hypothetical protein